MLTMTMVLATALMLASMFAAQYELARGGAPETFITRPHAVWWPPRLWHPVRLLIIARRSRNRLAIFYVVLMWIYFLIALGLFPFAVRQLF